MILMDMEVETAEVEMEMQEIMEKEVGGTKDYEKLINLPKLNGNTIIGDMEETDPTVPEWAKAETKPLYKPEEIGALSEDAEVSLGEIKTWFD